MINYNEMCMLIINRITLYPFYYDLKLKLNIFVRFNHQASIMLEATDYSYSLLYDFPLYE